MNRRQMLLVAAFALSLTSVVYAGSATWRHNPVDNDYGNAANWMPNTVPNGSADTATFDSSNKTGVSLSASTEVNGIVFNAGASAFSITVAGGVIGGELELTVSGAGIANNSGINQQFITAAASGGKTTSIGFTNSATAGNLTVYTNKGSTDFTFSAGGQTQFFDNSTAGTSAFTNDGAAQGGLGQGSTGFFGASTAASATFVNKGGAGDGANGGDTLFGGNSTAGTASFSNNTATVGNARGGQTLFIDSSTAGNATFTNAGAGFVESGGGETVFRDSSTAGNGIFTNEGATLSGAGSGETSFHDSSTANNATLIANPGSGGGPGGLIRFFDKAVGGTARVEVFGTGSFDLSGLPKPGAGVIIGSIEGDGLVFLGGKHLTVGGNDLSTNFSGVIQDGGFNGGSGGALTKTGSGRLVLSHSNTYTGGTTLRGGKLVVNNASGSGTGSGPVQVNRGRLGGKGTIAGAVTVGTGRGNLTVLAPGYVHGNGSPGALTIKSSLTLIDGKYEVNVDSSNVTADEVIANGVTIKSGAKFSFADIGSGQLSSGTVFRVISNTAVTPIVGTFSNLADGSTFTSNGNSYRANYEGGDGNDLTLTVVP